MAAVSTTAGAPRTRSLDREKEAAERAALRAATYVEFMLGHGEAPGIDLGAPVQFGREGTVYSQRFACGLTLANVGDERREVALERPYYDLTGALRASVVLPARSAEVLRLDASPWAPSRRQDQGRGAAHRFLAVPIQGIGQS